MPCSRFGHWVGFQYTLPEGGQHILVDCLECVLLMLSPPCTVFSELQRLWNIKRIPEQTWKHRWEVGMVFLKHSMHAAQNQVAGHRFFAFEHPASASSWKQPCVQAVQSLPGVETVVFDQCMLGLKSKVNGIPMRKRTRIMTNSRELIKLLSGKCCDRTHAHECIQGSEGGVKRSVWAQVYPPGLVQIIAEAARLEKDINQF